MANENNDLATGLGSGDCQLKDNLALASTTKAFIPTRMTTAQRDALSAVEGMVIYNLTTHKINIRVAAAWEAVTSA